MIEINIENIVASTIFAEKLDLDYIAQSIEITEYEPEQFPGLIFRLKNPKTATLLFCSGKANCTGAKSIQDVRKALNMIAVQLQRIGIDIYDTKELKIIIQNIVATANLKGELNLNQVAVGLGLENIEYEPEQFPGLVYRVQEPKVAMLLFSSGKIVCAGGRTIKDVSLAVENLSQELISLGLFL
ncbi:MAG: TATA-box-binding protein [Promethearchaeota archaeon]|jgi:transcription initiation factor TFIID TATA-box-binding protein